MTVPRILIIGATSAIAAAVARQYAGRGARMFLVARDPERLQQIAADMSTRGAVAVATLAVDLTERDVFAELVHKCLNALGEIDVALIAHGSLPDQLACETSIEQTVAAFDTNAVSVVTLITLLAQQCAAQRFGTIAVISSVAGDRGRASNYVYGSAKAMVSAFASGLRQRLHPLGVNVLTIKPGFVDTPMTQAFAKGILWAQPAAVGRAIVRSIDRRRAVIYIPWFWRPIMWIIRMIPETLFMRRKL